MENILKNEQQSLIESLQNYNKRLSNEKSGRPVTRHVIQDMISTVSISMNIEIEFN